eukprot:m.1099483 g.1099483  ORF g.1099483 m.1099483 type:complete len:52 (-) comp24316_c0_seq1:74-229(-)
MVSVRCTESMTIRSTLVLCRVVFGGWIGVYCLIDTMSFVTMCASAQLERMT